MQTFKGIKQAYTTVRRGLNGYRALVMSWDNEAQEYKITKRDPGVYQARQGAVNRAIDMARANGWECST